MEIKGSHVLITGAEYGIGRAVALMCAEDKAHLHLVVQRSDSSLADEMEKAGAQSVTIHEVNLAERKQIELFLKKIQAVEIDILFNNAEQSSAGLFEEQAIDDIYNMIQINVNATFQLTHALLPGMLKRNRGKIINHSSVAAVMNFPSATTYAATKAAIFAFNNSLRAELLDTKVTTLVLLTPGVDVKMFKEIPKIYGTNLELGFLKAIPARKYAQMIREAILEDLPELKPSGLTAAGLLMAQHLPKVFENLILKRFKRS